MRLIALGLCLLLASATYAADKVAASSGEISGRVFLADDGAPLAGALITLEDARTATDLRSRSAADGSYSFDGLTPGDYFLVAYKTGFLCAANGQTSLRLKAAQKLNGMDFHLVRTPHVEEMKDEALASAYSPQERLYANFTSGRFSPDGSWLAIVAGDIVSGDPEQVWLYGMKSQQLVAVTGKPTVNTSPEIEHVAWDGDSLYVKGLNRANDKAFLVIADSQSSQSVPALTAGVNNIFEREDAVDASGRVTVGEYVLSAVPLHGGDVDWSAHKEGSRAEFAVASAINGNPPIFDSASATVFYPDGDGFVVFDLSDLRSQQVDLPRYGGLTLLAARRDKDGFLVAYAVLGSCRIEESPDGDDPWMLPRNVELRRQKRAAHVCFVRVSDEREN